MHFTCCPDIPVKYFDESLTNSKVTASEYAQLAQKLKASCNNLTGLRILYALRWMTRLSVIFLILQNLMADSIANPVVNFSPLL